MLKKRIAAAVLTASVSLATAMITLFEGVEHEAYLDPVGVVTICYGHTATAKLGQVKTEDECQELLRQDLAVAMNAVERHTTVDLTIEQRAALASFVFNFGETKYRTSTLLKKLNAGDKEGACAEMSRWVNGKVNGQWQALPGLVTRREVERSMCEVGL
jgi:lysozyme